MFYQCDISIEPKDGESLPDAATIGSYLYDVLADVTGHAIDCPFRVTTLAIGQAGTEEPS